VVRSAMAAWQEVWFVAANPGGTLRRLSMRWDRFAPRRDRGVRPARNLRDEQESDMGWLTAIERFWPCRFWC
jgi:hypothetical protein